MNALAFIHEGRFSWVISAIYNVKKSNYLRDVTHCLKRYPTEKKYCKN